jgi:hypothetical protein
LKTVTVFMPYRFLGLMAKNNVLSKTNSSKKGISIVEVDATQAMFLFSTNK